MSEHLERAATYLTPVPMIAVPVRKGRQWLGSLLYVDADQALVVPHRLSIAHTPTMHGWKHVLEAGLAARIYYFENERFEPFETDAKYLLEPPRTFTGSLDDLNGFLASYDAELVDSRELTCTR